jgi:glycosyltransferase involved in cell wall biosynthesis
MQHPLNKAESELPKLSIIIVTLNVAHYLQDALNSIYAQTYPNIEIVIMDGLSTDGTVDILKANDDKIALWRSEKDGGIYEAMNKALDYITGEWVYFLGADDVLFDDFSKLAYELKDQSVLYYANVMLKDIKYRGQVTAYMHAKSTICHQAMIYPKWVFDKYRFNTKYRISADHELNMRCWKDPNLHFKYFDLIIARFNHTGASSAVDLVFEKDKADLIRENHGFKLWLRFVFRRFKGKLLRREPARFR